MPILTWLQQYLKSNHGTFGALKVKPIQNHFCIQFQVQFSIQSFTSLLVAQDEKTHLQHNTLKSVKNTQKYCITYCTEQYGAMSGKKGRHTKGKITQKKDFWDILDLKARFMVFFCDFWDIFLGFMGFFLEFMRFEMFGIF